MIPTSGHVSKLPTSSTASAIPHPKLLVEIRESGEFFVEGQQVTAVQVTQLVKSRGASDLAVTIAGSSMTTFQRLMDVTEAVRNGGATQIGLAARKSAN